MKKVFIFTCIVLSLFFSSPSMAQGPAVERFATCDACGYCPEVINGDLPSCVEIIPQNAATPPINKSPGNWKPCVRCLYPDLYPTTSDPDPAACDTVRINPDTNMPPTPYIGRQYTMIGCLTSDGGFGNNTGSGASSFVQALFDLLVFRIMGGIAFLYLLYGAFLVLTSRAEPERLNFGKRVIIAAVVGLIFALSSVFIVNLIGSGILRLPGFTGTAP